MNNPYAIGTVSETKSEVTGPTGKPNKVPHLTGLLVHYIMLRHKMWYLVWCPVGPATSLLVSLQTQTHAGADAATYAPSLQLPILTLVCTNHLIFTTTQYRSLACPTVVFIRATHLC